MRVIPVPCLSDNYAYLVVAASGDAAIVDASEADPVRDALRREGATPRAIWSTHHHWDHVGGNADLAAAYDVEVVGHVTDANRTPALTQAVESGTRVRAGSLEALCFHVPGHTAGALAYLVEDGDESALFTGDTLFVAGCGRLFEGTPAQMFASLRLLSMLPGAARLYCGHEYTEQNLRFAAHVEPSNAETRLAVAEARESRTCGKPTVGSRLEREHLVNPFLRVRSDEIRTTLGIDRSASDIEAFAAIRRAKDAF